MCCSTKEMLNVRGIGKAAMKYADHRWRRRFWRPRNKQKKMIDYCNTTPHHKQPVRLEPIRSLKTNIMKARDAASAKA